MRIVTSISSILSSCVSASLALLLVFSGAEYGFCFSEEPVGSNEKSIIQFGEALFESVKLSGDNKTSCSTCHVKQNAYSDPRPISAGVFGKLGTRNAPSLVGVADDFSFFWDGRRIKLEDAVLDPITNPVEMGMPSLNELIVRVERDETLYRRFNAAFPARLGDPTVQEIQYGLASFVRSLSTNGSAYDKARAGESRLSALAQKGERLFTGRAGCSTCHSNRGVRTRFSDEKFHFSAIQQLGIQEKIADLAITIIRANLDADKLGPKVLLDPAWSAMGRFVVSRDPVEIGAFRTPSLRNVAVTAPYMHDGSVPTLIDAVNREIYYHVSGNNQNINLTATDRDSLVEFLESLTDTAFDEAQVTASRP